MATKNGNSVKDICCLALSLALKDLVYFPGSPGYTASLGSYASAQETAVQPRCIVGPRTTKDVSAAVRVLTTTATSPPGCQFAVRSGGHAVFSGAANIEGGVTIDLSALNSITISKPAGGQEPVVSVGVGARWGEVYARLDPLNLSANGARAGSVGVGGLTLGGGISYFGPRFGWACDSVTNFELVLADGSIINANNRQNADLLSALRGGANNFGIVTRIDTQTFQQGNLWGGQVIHPISTANEQIAALAAFSDPATYDEFASLITTFAYSRDAQPGGLFAVGNQLEYTKPVENPPVFQSITSLPPPLFSTMRITNLTDIVTEVAVGNPDGVRQLSATLTIKATVEAVNATVQAWNASVASVQQVPGIIWGVVMDPLPPQLYGRHAEGNALGLGNRRGKSLIVVQLFSSWSPDAGEYDEVVDAAARRLIQAIEEGTKKVDGLDPFLYINYAAPWQNPIAGYGKVSVDRLREVRRRYDPRGVFTKLVPGGFKLP